MNVLILEMNEERNKKDIITDNIYFASVAWSSLFSYIL